MDRMFFIGGTGQISQHTVRAFQEKGCEVALFTRGQSDTRFADQPAIRLYSGDRDNLSELAFAIDDYRPDVVLDFICFRPEQAKQSIDLTYGKVGHFIFVSTVDVYGYPLRQFPGVENAPFAPAIGSYAYHKQLCEQEFFGRHHPARFPVTVVRPLYSLGARFLISFFSHVGVPVVHRIREGLPILIPGNGTLLMHPSDARDTGRMIAEIAGNPVSFGKGYNCGTEGTIMTQSSYIHLIGHAVGRTPHKVYVPNAMLDRLSGERVQNSIFRTLTRFDAGFSLDNFKRDFPGFQWQGDLLGGMRSYVERAERLGLFADAGNLIVEDDIIVAWNEALRLFEHIT